MPSPRHKILVELFRHCPGLITALLALVEPALVSDIPGAVMVPAPAEIPGVHHAQYRADLVLHRMAPGEVRPAHAFVLEVQLAPDADKDFTWPMHAAGIAARDRCPVTLVVLALDERTARWAAAPRALRIGGPAVVAPAVIGPAQIPHVIALAQAHALPELAVLSVAAHGHAPGAEQIYAEGLKEGRNEALRGLLVKQLTRRFGLLPEAAMSRIQAADLDLLEHWGERLISATSLDDVFADAS